MGAKLHLEGFAKLVDDEIDAVRDIDTAALIVSMLSHQFNSDGAEAISPQGIEEFSKIRPDIATDVRTLRDNDRRLIGTDTMREDRRAYIEAADAYFTACRSYLGLIAAQSTVYIVGDAAIAGRKKMFSEAADKAKRCYENYIETGKKFFPQLTDLSKSNWTEIRLYEREIHERQP